MVGPLNRPYFRGIVVSVTGLLASELWKAMDHIAKVSRLKGVKMYRTPTPGHIEGNHEAVVDFLAADKSTGHAVGCDELIIDEAGLLGEEKRPLWNACYSSMSARDGRMLMISIRGHSPMFTEVRPGANRRRSSGRSTRASRTRTPPTPPSGTAPTPAWPAGSRA